MKYWEILADNLSKSGWSWGCVSAIDSSGRTFWIADAHRDDRKRFMVRADEKLTAFVELNRLLNPLQPFPRIVVEPYSVTARRRWRQEVGKKWLHPFVHQIASA
jgi:hypothetical protein